MVVVLSKLYLPHSCGCGCYCCHGIEVIVLIIADVVGNIVIDGVDVAIVTVVVAVIRSRYGCRNYFCGNRNC